MNRYLYEAVFTPVANGFEVSFPELGLFTQGKNIADAAYMANDLLTMDISERLAESEDVPLLGKFGAPRPHGGAVMGIMAIAEAGSAALDEMTAQDAADMLDVSRARIYAMTRDGILIARKVGSALMITTESVKARLNTPRSAGRPKKTEALQADSDGSVDRELKLVHEASGMAARMSGLTDDESERLRNLCAASTREETHADMYDAIIDDMEASHI